MKKLLSAVLALALCVALCPAVLAAEETGFADVPAGSWFEREVAACAEAGIMVGVGDGLFAPDRELTKAECLTLALRLYDLTHGAQHTIDTAPDDWGKLTLTLADGTVFEGYGYKNDNDGDNIFQWWAYKNDYRGVYVQVPGFSYEDMAAGFEAQQAWMDAHPDVDDGPATLTLNGVTYQGTINCWMPVGPYVLQFQPEADQWDEVNDILHHAVYREVCPHRWWRDVCYTVVQRDLEDVFDPWDFDGYAARRSFFAQVLATACGEELEQRFAVEAIPDLAKEEDGSQTDDFRAAVYTLYEAGVLTGTDEYGTFDADGTLTRAQAAVICARVLDESLRLTTAPGDPE